MFLTFVALKPHVVIDSVTLFLLFSGAHEFLATLEG